MANRHGIRKRAVILGLLLLGGLLVSGCGDAGDLQDVTSAFGLSAPDLEIHRAATSRSGWCRFGYSGPEAFLASSTWVGPMLDTAIVLLPADQILVATTEERAFKAKVAHAAELAGLAACLTPGVKIWPIRADRADITLRRGGRIRVSHLIYDGAKMTICLVYAYLYG